MKILIELFYILLLIILIIGASIGTYLLYLNLKDLISAIKSKSNRIKCITMIILISLMIAVYYGLGDILVKVIMGVKL